MYLFDTDVLSLILRGRAPAHVVRKVASVPPDQQFTSAITLGEIAYGAAKAKRADLIERARREIFATVLVLPFDAAAAERYGPLRAELERRGKTLAEPDMRIAAIALARGLTLVTGNTRHFERVRDLRIENWIVGGAP